MQPLRAVRNVTIDMVHSWSNYQEPTQYTYFTTIHSLLYIYYNTTEAQHNYILFMYNLLSDRVIGSLTDYTVLPVSWTLTHTPSCCASVACPEVLSRSLRESNVWKALQSVHVQASVW